MSCKELSLTLTVPRAWEISYMQPCIKCRGKSATHFVYFWSLKTLPYTHLEATSYIPQQGQSLHIWTSSLSTTDCYKNKYTIQLLWMVCISWFAAAIWSGETELALGTIRLSANLYYKHQSHFSTLESNGNFLWQQWLHQCLFYSVSERTFLNFQLLQIKVPWK